MAVAVFFLYGDVPAVAMRALTGSSNVADAQAACHPPSLRSFLPHSKSKWSYGSRELRNPKSEQARGS